MEVKEIVADLVEIFRDKEWRQSGTEEVIYDDLTYLVSYNVEWYTSPVRTLESYGWEDYAERIWEEYEVLDIYDDEGDKHNELLDLINAKLAKI